MKGRIILLLIFYSWLDCAAQVDSVYRGKPEEKLKERRPQPKNDKWKENLTWGGNFQAWVGGSTFVFLSPTLGYIPFKNFNVGLGVIYNYTSINTIYGKFAQSIFGGHSYLRYIIADSYFLQAQYDRLRQPDWTSTEPGRKTWVDYPMIGGGFRQRMSNKVALSSSVMYNLKPHPLSIYPFRVILQFGITGNF